MITTALQTAAAIGGTAGKVLETKTTANALTGAFALAVRLTNGNVVPGVRKLSLRYVSSPFDLTAAQAEVLLDNSAKTRQLEPSPNPAGVNICQTELEPLIGQYIYVWLETELWSVAGTVDVSLVEVG